ncbi:MAG: hypothetical protein CMJ25_11540 [Phycisphaerae bacterium]|nr:hypothetical protein [Phycisphaerae bacterium]
MTTRSDVTLEATDLIDGDRNQEYGDPFEMHKRAADIYNAYAGSSITAHDMAMILLSVKMARLAHMPLHRDSYVDICGYAGIGYEIADRMDKGLVNSLPEIRAEK